MGIHLAAEGFEVEGFPRHCSSIVVDGRGSGETMVRASGFAIHIAVCPLSNARVLAGRTLWRWRKVVVPGNDSVERDSSGLLTRPVGRPSHKPVVGNDRSEEH